MWPSCDWTDSIWRRCCVTNGLPLTSSMSVEFSDCLRSIGRQSPLPACRCASTISLTLKMPWNELVVLMVKLGMSSIQGALPHNSPHGYCSCHMTGIVYIPSS